MADQPTIPFQYRVAGLLARKPLYRLWELLYLVSLRGLGYNNPVAQLNGEDRQVRQWLGNNQREPLNIFDVGANVGDFTAHFKRHAPPRSEFFLFEPNPKTCMRLRKRFSGLDNVHIEQAGVGAEPGRLPLYDVEGSTGTAWASFHPQAITDIAGRHVEAAYAEVITVDDYCRSHDVGWIDYLKIDTEGFEREVLHGCRNLIESHRVRTIQLEWNDLNVLSGFSLYHLSKLLPGFEIHRILPRGTVRLIGDKRPYHTRFDIPRYSNLVCFDPRFRSGKGADLTTRPKSRQTPLAPVT